MEKIVAVLLTCHNRKQKTIECLDSLFKAVIPQDYKLDVFLTNDGSTDGTAESVRIFYPSVNIIEGNGNLFWAGGMRLAWRTAMKLKTYDAFLLLNDDVKLKSDFILNLLKAEEFSLEETGKRGIYSGATEDEFTGKLTYGGLVIKHNHIIMTAQAVEPTNIPQRCDLLNANILWISKCVVDKIGIFDDKYTHGIADFDYSQKAAKNGIILLLAPNSCGLCSNDKGNSWKSNKTPLKERVKWMKSPKGLSYNEYLFYIRRYFPNYLPYSFIMLWAKTFFPFFWDKYKN